MLILFLLFLLLTFVYWYTYPRLGQLLYQWSNRVEARLYGFKRRLIEVDNINHHVWVSADSAKPMLLLIHGFSADHAVWLRFAKYFTHDFFVIIPDLAGHGETGYSIEQEYSIDAQAQRVCALMKLLNHTQAHLVGNSMGGMIGAHIASYYPQHALSLTVIDPAGVVTAKPSPMAGMLALGQNPFLMDSRADFQRFYTMVMARPPYFPRVVRDAIADNYITRKPELAKIYADFNRDNSRLAAALPNINCPSLIIWGAKDELIDVSGVEPWQQALSCNCHVWYDLGHMPMLEAPQRTAYAVQHHLNRI